MIMNKKFTWEEVKEKIKNKPCGCKKKSSENESKKIETQSKPDSENIKNQQKQ
jgi:hypothetical protein